MDIKRDTVPAIRQRAKSDGPSVNVKPHQKPGRKGFDEGVREKVIAAARRAMEKGGLDNVKARFIAKEASISVGSIYNLFDDLDDLVRIVNGQTYDALLAHEVAALNQARRDKASAKDQMIALSRAYLEFVVAQQGVWNAALSFNRSRQSAQPDWYVQKERALFQVIEDVIGDLPGASDPVRRNLSARALWASVHGIVTMAVADGFLLIPVEEVWQQIQIIIEPVAAALEKPRL